MAENEKRFMQRNKESLDPLRFEWKYENGREHFGVLRFSYGGVNNTFI